MSEWRGLHNPDRHEQRDGYVICTGEFCATCHRDRYCRCCLDIEVQQLRAQVQRVRELCEFVKFQHWKVSKGGALFAPPWIDLVLAALDGDA